MSIHKSSKEIGEAKVDIWIIRKKYNCVNLQSIELPQKLEIIEKFCIL